MPKITVYVVSHNYGRFLSQAIESVLRQTFTDWEAIIIDDGSEDNTPDILKAYESHPSITTIRQPHKGLVATSNGAIKKARGEYIIRLDGDDYLDENALLVLSRTLDTHPDVVLVYPDYYHISEKGEILDIIRRKKIQDEVRLLDLPAHGAGTMIRKKCLEDVGCYDDRVDRQDGYDLWLKVIDRFKVYNVNLPLFYYRRHSLNLTNNIEKILKARRQIKRRYVQEKLHCAPHQVLAIIPVRGNQEGGEKLALRELVEKPLLQHVLDEVKKSEVISRIVVTTEDHEIATAASRLGVEVVMRPQYLARINVPIEPTVLHVLKQLKERSYLPNIVALIYSKSPFVKAEHITEAVDTQLIYRTDSVISVYESTRLQYRHRMNGLEPLFQRRPLRIERDILYEENGIIYVSRTNVITEENFLGKQIGHIIMTPESSLHVDGEFEFWLAEKMLDEKEKLQGFGKDL